MSPYDLVKALLNANDSEEEVRCEDVGRLRMLAVIFLQSVRLMPNSDFSLTHEEIDIR